MKITSLIITGILSTALSVSAAVVATESKQGTVYTVSSTDLLETSSTGFTDTLAWR